MRACVRCYNTALAWQAYTRRLRGNAVERKGLTVSGTSDFNTAGVGTERN